MQALDALLRFEGRRRVALSAALLLGAIGAWISWGEGAGAAVSGALLVGAGLSSTPTIVTAYARERCTAEQYPQAFSLATAVMGIGVDAVVVFALSVYGLGAAFAALDRISA